MASPPSSTLRIAGQRRASGGADTEQLRFPADVDRSAREGLQSGDRPEQGRFARSVRPDDPDGLADGTSNETFFTA